MRRDALDLQARENRSLGIVFVCARSAEQREDAVSGQVLDGSPVPFDDLTEVADRAADDLDDVFRVELRSQSGRSRHVGEQGRDGAPPGGDRRFVPHSSERRPLRCRSARADGPVGAAT